MRARVHAVCIIYVCLYVCVRAPCVRVCLHRVYVCVFVCYHIAMYSPCMHVVFSISFQESLTQIVGIDTLHASVQKL